MIIAVNFQFKQLERWNLKKKKIQGFNGIRTRDLRVAGALLYQLSYEATHEGLNGVGAFTVIG